MPETSEQSFRRLVDAFSAGEQESVVLEIVSRDFKVTNAPSGAPTNRDGWIATSKMFQAAFPDIHVEITDIVVENDRLAIREVVTGTHNGELMGIALTGKSATVESVHFVRFDGGSDRGARIHDRHDVVVRSIGFGCAAWRVTLAY